LIGEEALGLKTAKSSLAQAGMNAPFSKQLKKSIVQKLYNKHLHAGTQDKSLKNGNRIVWSL